MQHCFIEQTRTTFMPSIAGYTTANQFHRLRCICQPGKYMNIYILIHLAKPFRITQYHSVRRVR